jgi:hypothetical protein
LSLGFAGYWIIRSCAQWRTRRMMTIRDAS